MDESDQLIFLVSIIISMDERNNKLNYSTSVRNRTAGVKHYENRIILFLIVFVSDSVACNIF